MRNRAALVVFVVLVLVVAAVVTWRVLTRPSAYQQAVGWLPAATLRANYTDWAQVRAQVGGTPLGPGSSRGQVERFLERAYDRDLTAASAVSESTYVLLRRYGFSPLDARWEIFGQSRKGAVDIIRLDDSVDMAGIGRRLRRLGYTPPREGSVVWAGSADLVAALDLDLSSTQQNLAVLPDEHLVLMGDNATYLAEAVDVVRGSAQGLDSVAGVSDLAGIVSDSPLSARLWPGDFACEDLSMATADDEDRQAAKGLVAKAGGISPLSGLVVAQSIAKETSRALVVGMHFESDEQASENLQPRVELASGPAPGQGGSFADRFAVTSAEADGSDVVLHLDPRDEASAVFTDLTQGPILFATC